MNKKNNFHSSSIANPNRKEEKNTEYTCKCLYFFSKFIHVKKTTKYFFFFFFLFFLSTWKKKTRRFYFLRDLIFFFFFVLKKMNNKIKPLKKKPTDLFVVFVFFVFFDLIIKTYSNKNITVHFKK